MKILKGDRPAPRGRDFTPTARRIDGERWAARLEAEKTIAAARAEAASIAAAAEEAGRERGHARAAAMLVAAQREAAAVAERASDLVVTATKAVAERALGHALTDEASLTAWAREALATFGAARRVVVRANSKTVAMLRDLGVELVPDDELDANVLMVRTELGDARVELRTQVHAFVEAIRDVLAAEVSRRA